MTKWQLNGNTVTGVVKDSIHEDYVDGQTIAVLNFAYIIHYPKMAEPEQWLIRSQTGLYFRIFAGEEHD